MSKNELSLISLLKFGNFDQKRLLEWVFVEYLSLVLSTTIKVKILQIFKCENPKNLKKNNQIRNFLRKSHGIVIFFMGLNFSRKCHLCLRMRSIIWNFSSIKMSKNMEKYAAFTFNFSSFETWKSWKILLLCHAPRRNPHHDCWREKRRFLQ